MHPLPPPPRKRVPSSASEQSPTLDEVLTLSSAPPPVKQSIRISAAEKDQNYPEPEIILLVERPDSQYDIGPHHALSLTTCRILDQDLVDIYMDRELSDPVPIKKKYSIHSLIAVSPIIKSAVLINGGYTNIARIALPNLNRKAYELLLDWINLVVTAGRIIPFPVHERTPLVVYFHVLEAAKALAITPLVTNLQPRFDLIVTYRSGTPYRIDPDDIRITYEHLSPDSELRGLILTNVARAIRDKGLKNKTSHQVWEVQDEIKEFYEELHDRITELRHGGV